MVTNSLGKFIVERRKELGLSQKDLADFLNVSIPTISKWENDERIPDLSIFGELAKLLKVDLESLLNYDVKLNNSYDIDNTFDIKQFSKYFIYLRKINNLSLVALAEKLNIRYQTISKWENEESVPNIFVLKECAKIFKVPISEIYYGKKFNINEEVIELPSKPKNNKLIFITLFSVFILLITLIVIYMIDNDEKNSLSDNSSSLIISNSTNTNSYSSINNDILITYEFNVDFLDPVSFVIKKGNKVNKYIPDVEGYNFQYFVNNNEFDFNTLLYEDTIILCELTIMEFTVNFYDQSNDLLKSEIVEYNKDATPPIVTSEDEFMVFYGWSGSYQNVKSNLDLYALFRHIEADITFDTNGGECGIEYIINYSSENYNDLPIPTKKGHTFTGWYLNGTLFTENIEVDNPIVLVAHYDANQYVITLNPNGGTCAYNDIKVTYGQEVSLPDVTNDDEVFIGWYYNNKKLAQSFIYEYDYNITIDAKYSIVSDLYKYVDLGENIELIEYIGNEEDIVIPSLINNKSVTTISNNIFDNKKDIIKTIKFPKSILTFKEGLLSNLYNLEKIYIVPGINTTLSNLFSYGTISSFKTVETYGDVEKKVVIFLMDLS